MSNNQNRNYPNCIMLTCADMATSVDFYTNKLGFTMDEAWPSKEKPMWASLSLDRQVIMLGIAMDPDPSFCPDDPAALELQQEMVDEFRAGKAGVGASFYINVEDVDGFFAAFKLKGGTFRTEPKSQFYGLREFMAIDPDGYRLQIYSNIQMTECQSCGMPLTEAKPGDMYCNYCTDDGGKLQSYESILEGTISGYFMGMQNMERAEAEVAAKEHLAKMPAWKCRE
ncbi:MAG: VOC family protein [Planctomycetes bacterium]|nr:VOC family protein [Planctomycetota bacterium]